MTILIAMNSSKSESSASPFHLADRAAREKALAGKITSTYESATFSSPVLDQFRGLMPNYNKRLSPDRDLGLSSSGHLRLSPETLPRLVSSSYIGIRPAALTESVFESPKEPAGKGFEITPDLPGRMLTGARLCSLSADLPMAPLASRLITLRQAEDGKEAEKDREYRKG
ncbi:MAG: hypothetical protein PHG79_08765 [Methanosarcina sp.]|nr:hypothetical protein [Methanosarcina sp.]MDD3873298.1 hypothetical protein [Methanosarcina sp.]MDD4523320.1 hypothetical protein [Methanosarcina sp.]HHV25316.1 hypothetical protein [Methanosarcina sp.]